MKKLVIGANGHIGAHLVRVLLKENCEVKALVRKTSRLEALSGLDLELVYGDVLDPESLAKAMTGCDGVFHLGAPTVMEKESVRIIEEGTRNVLEQASLKSIPKIVYTSSIVTIGYTAKPEILLDEKSCQLTPASPYHIAKFHAEEFALKFIRERKQPLVIVNPATVIGPLDYRVTPSNLPIRQCLNHGLPVAFDSGVTVVHAEDVARGHWLAFLKGKSGEKYILGGERMTIPDYFSLICRLCGKPKPLLKIPRWLMLSIGAGFSAAQKLGFPKVPFNYEQAASLVGKYGWYSSQKAAQDLGYTWRPIEKAVQSYLDWIRPRNLNRA